MPATVLEQFAPLRGAIAHAESWTSYLNAHWPERKSPPPQETVNWVDTAVALGINFGDSLALTWQLTFDNLFQPGEKSWTTVQEFEHVRREVYRLFFASREAMERTRQVAEAFETQTGRRPSGMDRLLALIEEARRLEETVFRDWPSFTAPLSAKNVAESLPVDESLAEALGISAEAARQRMEARRRELNAELG